jgi:hypothetical protein
VPESSHAEQERHPAEPELGPGSEREEPRRSEEGPVAEWKSVPAGDGVEVEEDGERVGKERGKDGAAVADGVGRAGRARGGRCDGGKARSLRADPDRQGWATRGGRAPGGRGARGQGGEGAGKKEKPSEKGPK